MAVRTHVVTVIGGGASGALAAHQLLRQAPAPVRVIVVEPRAELGRGVAYGTKDPRHLLNTRAGCMGADPDEPGQFVEWVRRQVEVHEQDFAPRARFGEYLGSLVGGVDHVRSAAVDVVPTERGANVVLAGGSVIVSDRVVLAPGPNSQRWPVPLRPSGRHWISDPWAPGALTGIRTGAPVLLVGTGLTAVDTALSLDAAGHHDVIAVSRRGLLPMTHAPVAPTPLQLDPPRGATPGELLAWSRARVAEVGDWRPVVDALRSRTDEAWGGWDDAERRHFVEHLQRRWETVRHRMSPAAAGRIHQLRTSGRLQVRRGPVRSVRTTRRGVDVRLDDARLKVAAVINCTGPAPDVRWSTNHLVRELLATRVVRPGPLGLGLATGADGSIVGSDGRLWLVGPLRRGDLWETTAIPEIRAQAAALPRQLWRQGASVGV